MKRQLSFTPVVSISVALLAVAVLAFMVVSPNPSFFGIEGNPLQVGPDEAPTATMAVPTATPTATLVPTDTLTVTATASATATDMPEPTPTTVQTATSIPGFTFFGSQLEFLRTNFGWNYEMGDCFEGASGVGNVRVSEPNRCVTLGIYTPSGDRESGKYLFLANYHKFPNGSRRSVSYDYMLYHYDGPFVDPEKNWAAMTPHTLFLWIESSGFREDVASYYGLAYPDELPPSVLKIIPLTEEEYLSITSRSDLFPGWIESHH